MNTWIEKHFISLVFGFIGTIFALIGAGFLWGYFYNEQEAKLTKQVPVVTATQLTDTPSGVTVAVEGNISERNTSHNGLVVYKIFQYRGYECDDDEEDRYECEDIWLQTERVTPALWLDLPDGRVRVGNNDYWAYNEPEVWQTTDDLIAFETLEYQGFRRGSPVFAVGKVNTNDGVSITIDFLYGGSREDYLADQADDVFFFLLMGGIFAAFGLTFLTVAVVTAIKIK